VERAGLVAASPYDLWHSFCSLLIHEGLAITEVAARAGNSPGMALNTYRHLIEEMRELRG
jgi:site-specific recombinase XerD